MNRLKNKIKQFLSIFLVVGTLSLVAEPARAVLVTQKFMGSITGIYNFRFGPPYGAVIGQPVHGSFTYDTQLALISDDGTTAFYRSSFYSYGIEGMSLVIGAATIRSVPTYSIRIINNYPSFVDIIDGFFPTLFCKPGSTCNNNPYLSFILTDSTQTALSSTALPNSLNLLNFSKREGYLTSGYGSPSSPPTIITFTIDPPLSVKIDIKPGGFPNSINLKAQGVIPVAILTTDATDNTNIFDASTVDTNTVRFGPTGNEAALVQYALEDVDGDGDTDMILHFNIQDTGFNCEHTSATLTGQTLDGNTLFTGTDSVNIVGCN